MRRALITFGGAGLVAALAIASTGTLQCLGAQAQYAAAESVAVLELAPSHATTLNASSPGPSWTGTVSEPTPGTVTLTIDRIGIPDDPVDPEWPIVVTWTYTAKDPSHSFTAQLFGRGSDRGEMDVRGMITSGYAAGRGVHLDVTGTRDRRAVLVIAPASEPTPSGN